MYVGLYRSGGGDSYMKGGRSWIWIELLPLGFMICSEDLLKFVPDKYLLL